MIKRGPYDFISRPLSWNSGDLHFNFNTDIYNNVEKVIWSKPAVGRYWIDVNASSVVEAQCFALVVTGQVTQVDHKSKIQCFAVPSPSPKDYSGTAWFAAACVGVGIFLLCLVMRQSRTKCSQNSGAHTDASVHDTPVVLQQVHAEFAPQLPQPRGAPQPLAMAEPVQQFPLHPPTPPQQVITSFRASAFVEKSRGTEAVAAVTGAYRPQFRQVETCLRNDRIFEGRATGWSTLRSLVSSNSVRLDKVYTG